MTPYDIPQRTRTLVPLTIMLDGVPYDITGATVMVTVKPAIDADNTDAAAIISRDITVHDAPLLGQTSFITTVAETDVAKGSYQGDIAIQTADGVLLEKTKAFIVHITSAVTRRVPVV